MLKQSISLLATLAALCAATPASASLYTLNFGTQLAAPSNCDDCSSDRISLGAGQTVAIFGGGYSGVYVGSNGYVTFDSPAYAYSAAPLDTQTVGKMIAGMFTDLDSRDDDASNVYVNDSVLGRLVITWDQMGHYNHNYSVRSTFQIVLHSDQFALNSNEAQIGLFYGDISDPSIASAGFGDGQGGVNAGEVALASQVAGSTLGQSAARWYALDGSTPVAVTVGDVPEPGSLALVGAALVGLAGVRRRRGQG